MQFDPGVLPLHFASAMSAVLLLDLDHTLYPSTVPTGGAVDARIVRYIGEYLGLPQTEANALRHELSMRYGTTLKGLEILHGVDRDHYCDFIQDVEDELMPPFDPALRKWLVAAGKKAPTYLFTNARRDWADRCLTSLGLSDLLAEGETGTSASGGLRGILDIGFMEWIGKPEAGAFAKVERFIRGRHGDARLIFVDDRLDNLEQARRQGWQTVWVRPHDEVSKQDPGHRKVDSLLELDLAEFL